ncbi:PAS domain S-box protein [Defluviimonas sp. SAOS-178_SWC]|uniref:PAS domain S-box protein n=1 Tax=Defluviimonas sp. SAOS-178_SWC TaxID=3121287 RepID=UPI003221DE9D
MNTEPSSTTLLDALLDAVVDAIFVADVQGLVIRTNKAARDLFGYDTDDLVGASLDLLIPDSGSIRHKDAIGRYLKTGQARIIGIGRDVDGLRKDGSTFPLHLSVGHARVDGNDLFVGVMHDLTRRKAAERALEQSQRMEALGELTGGVAHDFNNLLTVITGNLELLERSLATEPQRELMHDALEAAELGAALTTKLLALARRSVLSPCLLDPISTVTSAVSLLQRTLGPHIRVASGHDGTVWPIRADPTQLQTALINLAVNAQDAMPEGGTLTVSITNVVIDDSYLAQEIDVSQGEYVRISVTDSGIGMAEDIRRRAFEPFFTTKSLGKGTGLGLSMVYGFVRQSGGHATIYSEPGLGSTISLYFPATTDAAVAGAARPEYAAEVANTGAGQMILVVEDDEAVRRLSVNRIEALGYRTLSAGNADEALTVLADNPDIHAMFADIVMPGMMNGFSLAERVRSERPDIAILLTSGFAADLDTRGAEEFTLLQKPYRQAELATRLRILLSRRRG